MRRALLVLAGCGRIDFATRGGPGDAGDDAPGADAAQRFCATHADTVCADFDGPEPIDAGFTSLVTAQTGTLVLADLAATAPHSIYMTFGSGPVTQISAAKLVLQPPGTTTRIAMASDLYLVSRPTSGKFEINDFAIHIPNVGNWYNDIYIGAIDDEYNEEYDDLSTMFQSKQWPFPQMALGQWHHLVQTLDLSAKTFSLEVDGMTVFAQAIRWPQQPGPLTLTAGLDYVAGNVTPSTFYMDDIVIHVE